MTERKLVKGHETTGDTVEYQVRVNLTAEFTRVAAADIAHPSLKPLTDVLAKHNAVMKNQFQAFADYCAEAERNGHTDTVMYRWTKAVIDMPSKKEQYAPRYTIYADGGKETYSKEVADAVEADLNTLVGQGIVAEVKKFDTNPRNNPQAPSRFQNG